MFLSPVRKTGVYRRTLEYGLKDSLAAKAFPEARIKVAELFSQVEARRPPGRRTQHSARGRFSL